MKFAFVFPGQGSQSVGMLAELAEKHPDIRQTFEEASNAVGHDLWQVSQHGPAEELNQTHITQPIMLTAGIAIWRAWLTEHGAQPAVLAGHSLGEYTALVAAGSLGLADAANLVADRGRFMQQAVPAGVGAMAAILGLDDDRVVALCEQAAQGEVASAVNFNSPGQVVVAGHTAAVERTVTLAKEAGARRAVLLPVSVPSHCSLMMPAAEQLAERLAVIEINSPDIPVINNVDVAAAKAPDAIREALIRQLYSPVRWVETIQALASQGVLQVAECGPGKVLTGLNKRIDRAVESFTLQDCAGFQQALQTLK